MKRILKMPKDAMMPEPPDWLHERGREVWHRIGPRLRELGLLEPLYRDAFGRYCHLRAVQEANDHGPEVERSLRRMEREFRMPKEIRYQERTEK